MGLEEADSEAIIAAAVVDCDVGDRPGLAEREKALFRAARGSVRDTLVLRLAALAALPDRSSRTVADVDAMAQSLGIRRSATYRLLAKVARDGPVTGLLPRGTIEERTSKARNGLGTLIDDVVADLLSRRPAAPISEIEAALRTAVALMDEAERPSMPSVSAIRRRVQHLRSAGQARIEIADAVGTRLLIAQCALDLLLRSSGRDAGGYAAGLFVMDEDTSLCMGCAVYSADSAAALGSALLDLRDDGVPALVSAGVVMAAAPRGIRWRVAPGCEAVARQARARSASLKEEFELEMVVETGQRPGADVVRHLGETLPPLRLMSRIPLPSATTTTDAAGRGAAPILPLEEAEALLRHAAGARNARLLEGAAALTDRRRNAAESGMADFLASLFTLAD